MNVAGTTAAQTCASASHKDAIHSRYGLFV
jgi:hypothetical protein